MPRGYRGGYGYAFAGLGKRNREAFVEASSAANARVGWPVGGRGGADAKAKAKAEADAESDAANARVAFAAGATRVALGDDTNAARRDEAAPKAASGVGLEAPVENDAPKDTAGGVATATTLALKYVTRAAGNGLGGAPVVTLAVFNAELCAKTMNNETVRGVDFESIISDIYSRVSPSACARDSFARWLARGAPLFAATGLPKVDIDDDEACRQRAFRRTTGPIIAEWSSPLNAAESKYACQNLNAVRAAAMALDASEFELRQALEKVETATGSMARYLNVRGCYHYRIRTDDGLVFAYIGESVDVERRINEHLTALLGDGRAHDMQRGHALVRRAQKGDDDHADADFQCSLWVIHGQDEASAVELAKTYVKTCASTPSILEVARAIASAGFFVEAVFTAHYGTLHEHTADGVVGMNFSQPGVCHTREVTREYTWNEIRETSGKKTRCTKTLPAFTCGRCDRDFPQGKSRSHSHGDGHGRVCDRCYQIALYAKKPQFQCLECDREMQGKQSYRGDGDGRVCERCYQIALLAKRPPFTCALCSRAVSRGKASHPQRDGDGRVCAGCYQKASKANRPPLTCALCSRAVSRGKASHPQRDGDGRVCAGCYQKASIAKQPPFTCALCSRAVSRGKASHPQRDGDGRVCEGCYQKASKANRPPFTCALCSRAVSRGKVSRPQRDGDGRVCEGCYQKASKANRPPFTCALCSRAVSRGKVSRPQRDGDGRVCAGCTQKALKANQPPFTCALCSRAVSRGKVSHPQRDGDGRVCVGCYEKASKANQPPFTCALCSRAVSRGKVSRPQRDGDGRVCEACYRKCLASTREM
ncbi:unnamed product [Ostreococcus tauri]|uniref:Unnamed product n=1 Tax=Ostreococcus tauri TaxID=70448 RepID=Q00TP6_OSTTA|nr:unnamed product [Ostreococcus tauri]CAL57770.1 unnamed product [Ostreococcus tauri]|eukprot:XP_003083803.1 unnamed product [Ostreococcus tauri]